MTKQNTPNATGLEALQEIMLKANDLRIVADARVADDFSSLVNDCQRALSAGKQEKFKELLEGLEKFISDYTPPDQPLNDMVKSHHESRHQRHQHVKNWKKGEETALEELANAKFDLTDCESGQHHLFSLMAHARKKVIPRQFASKLELKGKNIEEACLDENFELAKSEVIAVAKILETCQDPITNPEEARQELQNIIAKAKQQDRS